MKKIFLLLPVLWIVFIQSCDRLEYPENGYYFASDTIIQNPPDTTTNDTLTTGYDTVKKVLLIEFTGIRCTNCPAAHEIISQIKDLYPGKFLSVSVHGTSFAIPIGEFSGQPDLRTEDGNALIEDWNISSLPIGTVDFFDAQHLDVKETWTNSASMFVNEKSDFGLLLQADFDSNTGKLDVSVKVKVLESVSGNYYLNVFVVEDSIITLQASDTGNIENYVQLNVFRDALTNVNGDLLISAEASEGQIFEKTFSADVPQEWNVKNCKILAFIYRESDKKILTSSSKSVNAVD